MSARLRASMIGPPIKQKKNTIYFNRQMEVYMKKGNKVLKDISSEFCCMFFFNLHQN